MHVSRSAIALAITAALSTQALVGATDAAAASKLSSRKPADPQRAQPHFRYPVHARAAASTVLYDQSGTAADGFPSQNFESAYDAYDSAGADDFIVSDAAGWSVGAFNFQIGASGDPSSATYDINVYPDAGGLPGVATTCSYSAIPGTVDGTLTSLSVSLPAPCNLAQGTYWVSVVANLDVAVGGQLFWSLSAQTPAPGSNAAWENPGDAFGSGCTTWSDNATCGAGSGFTTALFQVIGTVGVQSTCTPGGICLESTVGTDLSPNACGGAEAIDATIGDQLNFCYTVTNNTGVELDYHTLANNVDGIIYPWLQAPLPPGASLRSNVIKTVANTLTYTSTWTSYDVPPGFTADIESGGCGDRIFADGFGDGASACGGFVDITATGTALGLGDDDAVDVTMPFSFNFYGVTSNDLSISNNGGAIFGVPGAFLPFLNTSLPAGSLPGPAMFPLWDDFDSASGDVYTDVRGSAPNRQFIVEWFNRTHYSGNADGATFELILDEDGTIHFEYADVVYGNIGSPSDPLDCTGGACATIGLQGSTALFDQFSAFQPAVTDNSGIQWTPTSPQVFTSTDSVSVNVGAPAIVVNPNPISGTVTAGASTTLPFAVENHGDRDLDWSLTEAAPSNLHFAPSGSRYAMPMGDPSKSTAARAPFDRSHVARKPGAESHLHHPLAGVTAFAASVSDDIFETLDVTANNGITNVGAAQGTAFTLKFLDGDFSKAYGIDKFGSMANTFATIDAGSGAISPIGTSIASMDSNGWTGFAQDPTTGTLYASATTCGSSSHLYTIDRNTGAATPVGEMTGMGCAIWIAIGPDGLMYSVDIVNDALYAVDKTNGATSLKGSVGFNANYAQDADFDQSTGILYWAALNADTFAEEIRTVDLDTGATSLVYSLDAVQLIGLATETLGGPCAQPQDLPWLTLDPLGGTTPPSGTSPVSATVDATNANPGDILEGTVCATSNDPLHHRLGTPISVTVAGAPPIPPTLGKSFNPTQVATGIASTLTITLGNANATPAVLTAALVDSFPTGLVVAATPNAQTTCVGAVTAVSGSDSVVLTSGSAIPAGGCAVTVDVAAATSNDYANDIPAGALQTDAGVNAAPADATLVVASVAPTLAKAFAPSSITAGSTSTLTITLGNGNGVPVALTSSLTDTFPNGLVVAAAPNAQTTCGGGVTAAPGDNAVTLDGLGSVIPPSGACTITVDVSAATPSQYANSIAIGALQTDAGTNGSSADATLMVSPIPPIPPIVTKAFNPVTVPISNPATLTITLGNANATPATFTAPLVDAFPTDLVVAATPNASTTCGGALTADPASVSVMLDAAGASIPAGGSCTITVDVESALVGVYPNDIPIDALQTDLGNNDAPADASLFVTP